CERTTGPGGSRSSQGPRPSRRPTSDVKTTEMTMGHDLERETDEGAQQLQPRDRTSPAELRRERGAVLRGVPETFDDQPTDDETMIINMGPQHPSTHGVLRIMIELEGETVLRSKPVIGYLHTGMEKTGEALTYLQGPTNVTRMDYLAPL